MLCFCAAPPKLEPILPTDAGSGLKNTKGKRILSQACVTALCILSCDFGEDLLVHSRLSVHHSCAAQGFTLHHT